MKDDRHIEDMLRDTLKPTLPDGMRERTLRLARTELANSSVKPQIFGMRRWKVAFAVLGIAVVVFMRVSDDKRMGRVAEMSGANSTGATSSARWENLVKMRQEMQDMLVHAPTDRDKLERSSGEDSL